MLLSAQYKNTWFSAIGVGASTFWGCKGFLPKFSKTCPKSYQGSLPTIFWCDLQKIVFACLSATAGRHI